MNFKSLMIAVAALAAPAAGASAQGYYGYGGYGGEGYLPPAPYVYTGGVVPGSSCGGDFTLLGAHAGITVLGFGLNAGAGLTAPTGCYSEGYGDGYGVPQFAPRAYAPPPPAYGPPPPYQGGYGYQGQPAWSQQSYGYPCGCSPQGW